MYLQMVLKSEANRIYEEKDWLSCDRMLGTKFEQRAKLQFS